MRSTSGDDRAPAATTGGAARVHELRALVEAGFRQLLDAPADHADAELTHVLGRVGCFIDADRAYVLRFDHDRGTTSMTHEWCAPEVGATMPVEQDVPIESTPNIQVLLDRLDVSEVRDVTELPPEWTLERAYFDEQDIGGILEVPFTLDGRLSGVVGFDWVHRAGTWEEEDVTALRSVAALTERALSRQMSEEALRTTLSELADASDEVMRVERRFRRLVDTLPDAVLRSDLAGNVIYANPAAMRFRDRLLSMGLEAVNGWPAMPDPAQRRFAGAVAAALRTGREQSLEMHLDGNGDAFSSEVSVVPELDGPEPTLLVVFRDVTERRRHRIELERRATHDELTGLVNRPGFLARLAAAGSRGAGGGSPAVLFIDLDDFKGVNDSFGHAAGDTLLREVARRLIERLRPGDVVARFGGDELTVLLDPADLHAAMAVAESVRRCVAEPVVVDGVARRVTASIGVAAGPAGTDPAELLRWADAAVYRAKAMGGDRAVPFDEHLRREVLERRDLDRGVRNLVARRQLEVHYQPEVDLATGRVLGAEALARWNHPALGQLAGGRFIPVAEENGAVLDIGREVLTRSCVQVAEWRAEGAVDADFVLRVNLSTRQLGDPVLVPHLRAVLEATGLPPSQLCLEVTETAIMRDTVEAAEVLQEIRAAGVRLAIDDFGTGYSSLALLKRLPIDVVKIDHSFVDGLPDDPEDVAIVAAVMGLARSLHLEVTAEGVERPEQAAALLGAGCARGQGFLYSRPVTPDAFPELVRPGSEPSPVHW
ncbi:MAG: putative bifunctional diguanylate cyclase/phosphodiesterase [Microthrixaceae bacterium]